jgi:RNA polymerase sigma factor (sigma-70 family)
MKIPVGTAIFILNSLSKGNESEKIAAFELLHDHYWKILCRRLVAVERCDSQTAEDIVQETFIRIFKASIEGVLPEPEKLHSWVLIISKRIFIDKWRNKATEQSTELKKAKNKINILLKEARNNYSEALNSLDKKRIEQSFQYLSKIESKANTINGDYGAVMFEEALNEINDNSSNEIGDFILNFTEHEELSNDLVNNDESQESISVGTRREKLHNCIMDALQKLRKVSTERAEALSLDFDGHTSKEIASIINRTEQATRQFLSESRKAFRSYAEHCKVFYEITQS